MESNISGHKFLMEIQILSDGTNTQVLINTTYKGLTITFKNTHIYHYLSKLIHSHLEVQYNHILSTLEVG
jgi:hypothetical protein